MSAFAAREVEQDGRFALDLSAAEAFPLFSPLGEMLWVPGWDPELIHPPGATWERGLIFRTRDDLGEAIWIVTALDPEAQAVEYHRVVAGTYAARIRVTCKALAAARSEVRVTYTFIGLTDEGNRALDQLTAGSYDEKLARWKAWIEAARRAAS